MRTLRFIVFLLVIARVSTTVGVGQPGGSNHTSRKTDVVGTTWKIFEIDHGDKEWRTYTFLIGGKVAERSDAKWNLVGNKLRITERYRDINFLIKGDRLVGSGSLSTNSKRFPLRGIKVVTLKPSVTATKLIPVQIVRIRPDQVAGDDLESLWVSFVENIPSQGEFEKTGDYDKRSDEKLNQIVSRERRKDLYWIASFDLNLDSDTGSTVHYDPDREIMEVNLNSFREVRGSSGSKTILFRTKNPLRAYGRIVIEFDNYDIFFQEAKSATAQGRFMTIKTPVPIAEAPSAKANLQVNFIFCPTKPFWSGEMDFGRIGLFGNLYEVRILDFKTGKVYYDSLDPKTIMISLASEDQEFEPSPTDSEIARLPITVTPRIATTVIAKAGDTVKSLALRYNADPDEVASYNGLLPGTKLEAGRKIKLPNTRPK